MANDFGLMRGLRELSKGKEQRRAAKEQERLNRAYQAYQEPYIKALTDLQNAQTDIATNKELIALKKRGNEARTFGDELAAMQAFDLYEIIKKMRGGTEDEQRMARIWTLGIDDSKGFQNKIRLMGIELGNTRNEISLMSVGLQKAARAQDALEFRIAVLLNPELRDIAQDELGPEGVGAFKTDVIEKATGQKAIEKEGWMEGLLEKAIDLLGKAPADFPPGVRTPAPAKPKTAPPARQPSKAAPKRAQKPVDTQDITLEEMAPISDKARANDVDQLDIYKGIQELVQLFPQMTKEDKLGAADKIAEGFTIEEVIKHYQSVKEKDE